MLIMEGTGEGIAREAAEKNCCKKASNTLMTGMAMAASMGRENFAKPRKTRWGGQGEPGVAGVTHSTARPSKKAKRKIKQAQQRKNRKK